ncbi:XdhC family protein [Yoonia sp. 208BN28-4]|uniref:XdhC family protein n=1 Tax=Yoonia sp. 208BN28-4 TaxID=3126505 RepID=UPI0030A05420
MPDDISYVEHASDVIAAAADLARAGRKFALITSVGIEGGAAREVGSLALVDDRGAMAGYLSNGCIDSDIQFHATEALRLGRKQLVRYGNGSRFVDLKLPCGGALDVLIDPAPDLDAVLDASDRLTARHPTDLAFTTPDGEQHRFTYLPKFRLVLAGRGAIFRAVAEVAQSAGFQIGLLSPQEDDLAAVGHLAITAPVHLTSPDQAITLADLDAHAGFLTLFHDHEWEPALVRAALDTQARYVGCLGSLRTQAARKDTLRAMGVQEDDLARLRGPIGLVPSLREAPLIAISAIAEIVTHLPAAITRS